VVETPTRLDWPIDPEPSSLTRWFLETPQQRPSWGEGNSKSYWIPVVEIVVWEVVLNLFNRYFGSDDVYGTDLSSIKKNLQSGWVIDHDPFATNQFLHPYQGSLYHGFARSAGLNYWESLAYDFAGSALLEIACFFFNDTATTEIYTTIGGSYLGEALFRMSSYLIESGGDRPGFFRELGAALISPPTGFNRLAFGDRFDAVFPSNDPATYFRAGIGARRNEKLPNVDVLGDVQQDEVVVDFVMDYGLPGKPTYEYTRPFDYFHFELTAASSDHSLPEDVIIRGLLCGSDYSWGHSYRGVWGLYGGYDYISPQVFSVSSTSVSVGTTGQWSLSDSLALQGTLLGGVGWTAAGTIADSEADRDYHYAISPQGLAALRVILGDVAVLDMTGRGYYLGSLFAGGTEDSETILRGKVALTVRVYGHNAIGIQYVASTRDATFSNSPDTYQSVGAVSIFYTYISDTNFGAVEWR
jgi:hypothetical protein